MSFVGPRTFGPDRHDPLDREDGTYCLFCGQQLRAVGDLQAKCSGGPTGNDTVDLLLAELDYKIARHDGDPPLEVMLKRRDELVEIAKQNPAQIEEVLGLMVLESMLDKPPKKAEREGHRRRLRQSGRLGR